VTAPLPAAPPFVPPPLYGGHIEADTPNTASRVLVTGSARFARTDLVYAALTAAWRDAGQPLVVAHAARGCPLDRTARLWVADHQLAGNTEDLHPADHTGDGYNAELLRDRRLLQHGAWRVLAFLTPDWRDAGLTLRAEMAGLDVRRIEAT
jgi:hypothetical protein